MSGYSQFSVVCSFLLTLLENLTDVLALCEENFDNFPVVELNITSHM